MPIEFGIRGRSWNQTVLHEYQETTVFIFDNMAIGFLNSEETHRGKQAEK